MFDFEPFRENPPAFLRKHRRQALACNTPLQSVPDAVLQETYMNYQPQTRRPYGVMEWPGLLRMLARIDPSFSD